MSTYTRRLSPPPRDAGAAWLETLDDTQLEILEVTMTRLEAGGTLEGLPDDLTDQYTALIGASPYEERQP